MGERQSDHEEDALLRGADRPRPGGVTARNAAPPAVSPAASIHRPPATTPRAGFRPRRPHLSGSDGGHAGRREEELPAMHPAIAPGAQSVVMSEMVAALASMGSVRSVALAGAGATAPEAGDHRRKASDSCGTVWGCSRGMANRRRERRVARMRSAQSVLWLDIERPASRDGSGEEASRRLRALVGDVWRGDRRYAGSPVLPLVADLVVSPLPDTATARGLSP